MLGRNFGRDFLFFPEAAGRGAGLGGIFKDAEAIKLEVFDEVDEFLVLGGGFAGETGDEGGTERDAGDPVAEFLEKGFSLLAGDFAAHGEEDFIVDVLEGHVDVLDHVAALGKRFDHFIREAGGIGVHEADPALAGGFGNELVEGTEHAGEAFAGGVEADVFAVAGGVLADEVEFEGAIREEFFGFGENVRGVVWSQHAAADGRDGAEGATLVAAFGDAEVGRSGRGVRRRRAPSESV